VFKIRFKSRKDALKRKTQRKKLKELTPVCHPDVVHHPDVGRPDISITKSIQECFFRLKLL